MLSMFREAPSEDGKPGPVSARRVLAFISLASSLPMYYMGFSRLEYGWIAFIPGISLQLGSLVSIFFTTWSDISEIVKSAKGS